MTSRVEDMNDAGSSFLEVVIAMLLVAVMASSVFSVALTAMSGGGQTMREFVADQASRQLSQTLKNYVTGDPTNTWIKGPGGGPNAWSMDNPTAGIDDTSCVNCYALLNGTHPITGYMPSWFESTYTGELSYWVDYPYGASKGPIVVITVKWDEP